MSAKTKFIEWLKRFILIISLKELREQYLNNNKQDTLDDLYNYAYNLKMQNTLLWN